MIWCILGTATPRVKPSANLDTWHDLVHSGHGYAEGKTLGKAGHVASSGASGHVYAEGKCERVAGPGGPGQNVTRGTMWCSGKGDTARVKPSANSETYG